MSMTSGDVDCESRSRRIPSVLEEQTCIIGELEAAVSALCNRLGPVRLDQPEAPSSQDSKPQPGSPFASLLENNNDMIRAIIYQVRYQVENLEI